MTTSLSSGNALAARTGFMASLRDSAKQRLTADILAMLLAASLPWSTSAVAIFAVLLLIAIVPLIDWPPFILSLKRPAAALPLGFFAIAVLGILWSHSPWSARLHGINPVAKLLIIPFLFYHFERSKRTCWVLQAFLISCTLLMILSWVTFFLPKFNLSAAHNPGIPVKNYIDQCQEFTFCLFAIAPLVAGWFGQRRFYRSTVGTALLLAFFANMVFVASARTALVCIPLLLLLYVVLYLDRRMAVLVLALALLAGTLAWAMSPYLRFRVGNVVSEYRSYRDANAVTSTGERLEFWRKSLKFVSGSPLIGNGTGSIEQLFELDAVGQSAVSAEIVRNPHNQTLNVAVQWGLLGVVILYAMWICHYLLFRGAGDAVWIGILVVSQNFLSSLFNSHLFDFHEGWMYVLGIGVAGGAMLKSAREPSVKEIGSDDVTKLSDVGPR